MNRYLIVLLCGGLFIFNNAYSKEKIIFSETFVYKVANEVVTMSDIKVTKKELVALRCLYSESILVKVYSDLLSTPNNLLKDDKELLKLSLKEKEKLNRFISLSKLSKYVDTHNVYLSGAIEKAFYLASIKDCNAKGLFTSKKKFKKSFKKVLSMELFLRKRFLSDKKSKTLKAKELISVKKEIYNLLKTINRQVDSETYWSL